ETVEWETCRRECPGRTHGVVQPSLSPRRQVAEDELTRFTRIGAVEDDVVIAGACERNPDLPVDRGGQDVAVVDIRVFADEVDPARRANDSRFEPCPGCRRLERGELRPEA